MVDASAISIDCVPFLFFLWRYFKPGTIIMVMSAGRAGRSFGFLRTGAGVAVLITAVFVGATNARAEEGCPARQLPSVLDAGKCSKLSDHSQLPLDDSKPMVFEAIQDSATVIYLRATGTITPDTPAQFEKFLTTNDAKVVMASLPTIQLHSPGGDIAAGIKLGEMIRKARLNTELGRSFPLDQAFDNYASKSATCVSACALAFLGGVSRSYRDQDTYGFGPAKPGSTKPGSTDPAVMSAYIRLMGADPAALHDKVDADRTPAASARRMRIIFTPGSDSAFHAATVNGRPVARFDFSLRTKTYRGMVSCRDHETALYVIDRDAAIPAALYVLKDAPAEFEDGAKNTLSATATYIKGQTPSDGVMLFKIKGLTAASFSGRGLRLSTIDKPAETAWPPTADAQPDLASQMNWADRITEFSFVISSRNAKSLLPAVLNACEAS